MRCLIIATVAALAVAAAAALATAPAAPRLNGRFRIVATITANNFGVKKGTRTRDVYTFTAACRVGACAKVTLTRAGGSARKKYRSTLRHTAARAYAGTEGPYPYACPKPKGKTAAAFTARHTITVTRSRAGRVTRFRGTSKYTITHCGVGTFVDYTFTGTPG